MNSSDGLPVNLFVKKLLAERINLNRRKIWEWHLKQSQTAPPPFYSSVDLRDSGHKVVPVDSNLYPAGFNNICAIDIQNASAILRAHVEAYSLKFMAQGRRLERIMVLPESHTQNLYYIENLYYLLGIIREAGFQVELGWYPLDSLTSVQPIHLVSQTGKELSARKIEVKDGVLSAGDFVPDMILLNNDFSKGFPKLLDTVKQPIVPSHTMGWHTRKKSRHFAHYNELSAEFAELIGVDPWMIQIDTAEVRNINFNEDKGINEVAETVDRVLDRMRKNYETRKIKQEPFVFVKNNAGTYGMGIMMVHSSDEIRKMNRRSKNKMSVGKNQLAIDSVIVQEGVPTATLVSRLAAEPVIYLFGGELVGGFLRTNSQKGVEENLNSQGMVFKKLCMSDLSKPDVAAEGEPIEAASNEIERGEETDGSEPVLELVYGSIARISALAAGREIAYSLQAYAGEI